MIIIPMAGLSRRFTEAGYEQPKYMLPVGNTTLFSISVSSFAAYFKSEPFLFVYRDIAGTDAFVRAETARLGISDARFVVLDRPTLGQAETVIVGIERAGVNKSESLTVFNIDTIRPRFEFPITMRMSTSAGYLEVFRGSGSNWSFVKPDPTCEGRVVQTTEKLPVSDLCSTGLYNFARADYFVEAYSEARALRDVTHGEYYVAPLYNRLIARGFEVSYHIIDRSEVIFSGIPDEYRDLCRIFADRGDDARGLCDWGQ